jgi:ABC-2 type transport system ATP-binding protein
MAPKLSVRDLRKTYGRVEAVRGVSFEVQDREILGLLGPNGAGKTTTLECLIGLREPDAGEIEVCGLDARQRPRDVKQKIGAALQTTAFYAQRAAPEDLLQRFSLVEKADATFDTLSEGQRQRLALALAFVNRPEIVFLDEPTAGLDPQARRELHNEIARTRQDGHTVLLTTHYIDEAEHLCDRVAIIDHGRIVALGSPHDLMARSKASQSVTLVTAQPIDGLKIEGVPGVMDVVVEGARARFKTTDINRTMPDLLKLLESRRLELTELHVRKASLEDVFIELTGSALRD